MAPKQRQHRHWLAGEAWPRPGRPLYTHIEERVLTFAVVCLTNVEDISSRVDMRSRVDIEGLCAQLHRVAANWRVGCLLAWMGGAVHTGRTQVACQCIAGASDMYTRTPCYYLAHSPVDDNALAVWVDWEVVRSGPDLFVPLVLGSVTKCTIAWQGLECEVRLLPNTRWPVDCSCPGAALQREDVSGAGWLLVIYHVLH